MYRTLQINIVGDSSNYRRASNDVVRESKRASDSQVREQKRVQDAQERLAKELARQAKLAADAQAREAKRAADEFTKQANRQLAEDEKRTRQLAQNATRTAATQAREAARAAAAEQREITRTMAALERRNTEEERGAQRRATANTRAATQAAAAAQRAADSELTGLRRVLTQDEVNARARTRFTQDVNRQRIKSAQDSLRAESGLFKDTTSLAEKFKTELLGIVTGYASVGAAAGIVVGLAKMWNDASEAAAKYQKQLTKNTTDERDKLRPLATVMDEVSNTQFVKNNAQFMATTGMTFDESLEFRQGFQNSGAQHKGTKIAQDQYVKAERDLGQLAVVLGAEPEAIGEMGGRIAGMKDRSGHGTMAAQDLVGDTYRASKIMSHGNGNEAVLNRQFNQAAAAMHSEDAMRGVFNNSDDVATVISVAAEKADKQAFELTRSAIKGMRDFGDKDVAQLLNNAGVEKGTDFFQALKKIKPIIDAETRATPGAKTVDTLGKYFKEDLAKEGIGVFLDKGIGEIDAQGVEHGLFQERRDYAKQLKGYKPSYKAISSAQADSSQGVQIRRATADLHKAEIDAGASNAELATLYGQSEARQQRTGQTGTTASNLGDIGYRLRSWGMGDPRRIRTDANALAILNNRAFQAGLPIDDTVQISTNADTARRQLKDYSKRIYEAGGEPLRDRPGGGAYTPDELKENRERHNKEQADAAKAMQDAAAVIKTAFENWGSRVPSANPVRPPAAGRLV